MPPPPTRTVPANYNYHVYDNGEARPWTTRNVGPRAYPLYSLYADLTALADYANSKNVPRVTFGSLGAIVADGQTTHTLALRFGGIADLEAHSPIVVFTGGVHAREWIAPEMVYLLAEYLVRNYAAAGTEERRGYAATLSALVDRRDLLFVPLLNPAGNRFTVFGDDADDRLWRKNRRQLSTTADDWQVPLEAFGTPFRQFNRTGLHTFSYDVQVYNTRPTQWYTQNVDLEADVLRGIDLNRNYNTGSWGNVTQTTRPESRPQADTYFGPGRSSEQEVRNLTGYLHADVAASIDYHSYDMSILYSTEGDTQPLQRRLGLCLQRLIATKTGWSFAYQYNLGTNRAVIGYDALGTGADYMASQKRSAALTIELDPSGDNPGFELPPDQIQGVFEKNIRGALGFMAGASEVVDVVKGGCCYRHDIQTAAVSQFLNWNVWGRGNQLPA